MQPRHPCAITRRCFVTTAAAAAGWTGFASQLSSSEAGLMATIERETIFTSSQTGITWFHPRGCRLPGDASPQLLMTVQPIGGSDLFGPVHWTQSVDLGKHWTKPEPIPGFGRKALEPGWEEGVCDVVPEYHAPTRTTIAIGHNVYYRDNVLARPQRARRPVYVTQKTDGRWTEPRQLPWEDPRGAQIYTAGCAQRVTLPNGDLLLPISFGADHQTPRSVTTLRCSFDGTELTVLETGTVLQHRSQRGFLEPSLAYLDGTYYMTLRAEDGRGYVSRSPDGLHWEPRPPWKWETGEVIEMSTTQQRWLIHSEALYLVYTRKTPENADVFRWRGPIFVAEVDRKRLRLLRETEQVVFPLRWDQAPDPRMVPRMGNFHTVAVTPQESWITVAEENPENGWRGDTLLARIRWRRPNRLVHNSAS